MPTIVRPPKGNGNTTYVEETASGKIDIIDEEIDKDFFNIYFGANHLDDDNIQPATLAKRIAYEKLNLDGKIKSTDFAPGALDPAIAPGSIDAAQLAVGASTWTFNEVLRVDEVLHTTALVNYLTVSTGAPTPRGGHLQLVGSVRGGVNGSLGVRTNWLVRIRVSGIAGATNLDLPYAAQSNENIIPWTVPFDLFLTSTPGVAVSAAVDIIQVTPASFTNIMFGGFLRIMEHA